MDVTSTEVTFERVDELPILLHGLQQLQLAETIDEALPPPHGDRRGLSYGQLSVLLVAFIMSQAEYRLCAVEEWVNTHHLTLSGISGWAIGEKDATELGGLYADNPKHTTRRPSTESLLGAFARITLCRLPSGDYYITPLSPPQTQILSSMGIPKTLYQLPNPPTASLAVA